MSPKLVTKLVGEGHLPTFEKLMNEGAYGELESTIPPLSAPAWPSIVTGLNPGQHGIYGFITETREQGNRKVCIHNSNSLKGLALWDILKPHKKRSILVNVPLTHPPYPINGIMVSGFPSPGNRLIAYPKEVENTLREKFPYYKIDVDFVDRDYRKLDKRKFISDVYDILKNRAELSLYLLKNYKWDLFFKMS